MFHHLISVCFVLTFVNCCMCNGNTANTETPGFFLKVSKNIPRLGRRSQNSLSDFENFFLKTSKSVPRIGRSGAVSTIIISNKSMHNISLKKNVFVSFV